MSNAEAQMQQHESSPVEYESPPVEHEPPAGDRVQPAHESLRCKICSEVIGVYEPLIVLTHGQPQETSRAAREGVGAFGEECFHRACYTPGGRS